MIIGIVSYKNVVQSTIKITDWALKVKASQLPNILPCRGDKLIISGWPWAGFKMFLTCDEKIFSHCTITSTKWIEYFHCKFDY